jgi:hypothetical protein
MLIFTFSFGNSTDGSIGSVVDVLATSAAEALQKVKDTLIDVEDLYGCRGQWDENGVSPVRVYFNAKSITIRNIESVDPYEDEPEDAE